MIIKSLKWLMIVLGSTIVLILFGAIIYLQFPVFGKHPSGERLEKIKLSRNFRDGKFQNLAKTPDLTEGYGYIEVLADFIFNKHPNRIPINALPSQKNNLKHLNLAKDYLVWFGHSSYYLQLSGKRILVDPVFSGNASPVAGTTKAFKGTDRYQVEDLPNIDFLFVSHDHYDHLDYETFSRLKNKVKKVFCGLGVGAHLERWGYGKDQIVEMDWDDQVKLDGGLQVIGSTARHFSGRGITRNNTLWMSYLLKTKHKQVFIGGDSGYGNHYKAIFDKHGAVDLAILENGQYDKKWKYIHHLPHQVLRAALDLGAKSVFPVHSSKFALANHPWKEPLSKITQLNKTLKQPLALITPIIGQVVDLNNNHLIFEPWWEKVN